MIAAKGLSIWVGASLRYFSCSAVWEDGCGPVLSLRSLGGRRQQQQSPARKPCRPSRVSLPVSIRMFGDKTAAYRRTKGVPVNSGFVRGHAFVRVSDRTNRVAELKSDADKRCRRTRKVKSGEGGSVACPDRALPPSW